MSKNRRRSAQGTAAIEEQLKELTETPPKAAGSRRRSAPLVEVDPHWDAEGNRRSAAEPAEEPEAPGRSRRRSAQAAGHAEPDETSEVGGNDRAAAAEEPPAPGRGRRRSTQHAESRPSAEPREPGVGALSGQLPHGAEYRAGEISTEAGRYLRMAARDDAPAKFGAPAGEVDDAARRVWEIAFGLVVKRRFEPDSPLAEISRTVATAVHEHAAAGLPMLDAEMLVRHALGELVPVGDLAGDVLVAVHLLLFASIADELALGDEELDAIIADAEEKASALVPA